MTGSKQAARIAAPVPTLAGENGTSRPLHCANVDQQHGGERRRQMERGEEAAERREPQQAAEQLPRQHVRARRSSGHFSAEQPAFTRAKKRRAFA